MPAVHVPEHSSLPESKDGGVKTLNVTANNGDVNVGISNG